MKAKNTLRPVLVADDNDTSQCQPLSHSFHTKADDDDDDGDND